MASKERRKQITISVPAHLAEAFKTECAAQGTSQQAVLQAAVIGYILKAEIKSVEVK